MNESDFITWHKSSDPDLLEAASRAQADFRHFWYQVATDFNRIVPALEMAIVKAAFSDDFADENSPVEHMWLGEINFDGLNVTGTLLNSPDRLVSVSEGDSVEVPLVRISDWICCINDRAYGAYSVQVLRSRMNDQERASHDEAWGIVFPPPETVELPKVSEQFEKVMLDLLTDQIAKNPGCISEDYGAGRTLLHLMALYGRPASVRALLDAGAAADRECDRGWKAIDYARSIGWDHVVAELQGNS